MSLWLLLLQPPHCISPAISIDLRISHPLFYSGLRVVDWWELCYYDAGTRCCQRLRHPLMLYAYFMHRQSLCDVIRSTKKCHSGSFQFLLVVICPVSCFLQCWCAHVDGGLIYQCHQVSMNVAANGISEYNEI